MFFSSAEGRLFYKTAGEGIPLLFLHGFGADHRMMEAAAERFFSSPEQSFCRIYIDLPGMGQSDPLPPDHYADDACALLSRFMGEFCRDRLYGLISHSYGGYLSRGLIHDHPETILGSFFIAPVIHPMKGDRNLPPYEKRRTDESLRVKYPQQYDRFAETAVVESEYAMEMYLRTIKPALDGRKRENLSFYQKAGYSCSVNVDRMDRPFGGPSVFLLGKQDHIVGTRDALPLEPSYPKADFLLLDDAGHNLFFEQKEAFEFVLSRWLQRLDAAQ